MEKKLIVITGASSGIGAATAQFFSSKGYPLLLLARRVEKMQEMKLPNALCLKCDVTNFNELQECIEKGLKQFGSVDCIINNAGTMQQSMDPSTQSLEEWNQMIETNCQGLLNGIKAVLPVMKEQKQGTIINIGSVIGKKTKAGASIYCGTKFFVHAVSEAMREELSGSNIRVTTIAPGITKTDLFSHLTNEQAINKYQYQIENKIYISTKEVVSAIDFAYSMPQSCCVREIVIAATKQSL